VAIAYATRHPERVSHLIFWCSFSRASDLLQSPQLQGLLALLDKDWELFTEAMANVVYGWSAGEPAREFAAYMRESASAATVRAAIPELAQVDVSDLLPQVRCPTLVLHRRQMSYPDLAAGRYMASRIPGARLVTLEGDSSQFGGPGQAPSDRWRGDLETILSAVDEFLSEGTGGAEEAPTVLPSGTAVILFADIVDSTALTERLGDVAFRAKARDLDTSLRAIMRDNAGTPIEGKLLGDGVLAVFTSARQAIEAALASGKAGDEVGLPLHLGLHAGDVIREEGNVYGGAVNIAARISGLSAPGEVLVSDIVRGLARTSVGVQFEDRGEQSLKGVGEPVRVWAVVKASV